MDVRELKNILLENINPADVDVYLTMLSHWVKHIFDAPGGVYTTGNEKDFAALDKLAALDIITVQKSADVVSAELTDAGKKLRVSFLGHGYY